MTKDDKSEIEEVVESKIKDHFKRQDEEQSNRIKQWLEDFKDSVGGPYVTSKS